jgi:hypothetical protein
MNLRKVTNLELTQEKMRIGFAYGFPQYFEQMEELNVHGVNDVRQTEMHAAEPLVPERSSFKVEITIEKLKRYKAPAIDQILAQKFSKQEAIHCILKSTNLLILFGIRKNYYSSRRILLLYLFIKRVIKLTGVIREGYHCYQLHTEFYLVFLSQE